MHEHDDVTVVQERATDGRRPRVLLVDDNEVFRTGLREMLEDYEIDVVGEGANGLEALDLVERLRPDIVLMDMRMPSLDGIEASRLVKQRFPDVKVIMLSAYDDPELQRDAAEASVLSYLIKGSRRESIQAAIMGAFASSKTDPSPAPAATDHDALQQLTAAQMRLHSLRRLVAADPAHLAVLEQLDQAVEIGIEGLRDMMFEIRPPREETESLGAQLRSLLDRVARETGLAVAFEDDLEGDVPPAVRATLFGIAREAIENVAKHAQASRIDVSIRRAEDGVLVHVGDDGCGLSPQDLRAGVGVASMRDRAESAGGWCRIWSLPGAGTSVKVWIPA